MQINRMAYDVERRMWQAGYNTSHLWEEGKVFVDLTKHFVSGKGDLVPLMSYELFTGGIFTPRCHLLFKGKKLPLPK